MRRDWKEGAYKDMRKLDYNGYKEYIHHLDCGDGFWVYGYIKTYQIVHTKYFQFLV